MSVRLSNSDELTFDPGFNVTISSSTVLQTLNWYGSSYAARWIDVTIALPSICGTLSKFTDKDKSNLLTNQLAHLCIYVEQLAMRVCVCSPHLWIAFHSVATPLMNQSAIVMNEMCARARV